MKQVLIKQGRVVVEEVPAPKAEPGSVVVRVDHSCISIGTELSGIRESGSPLWKRAINNPQLVKKVVKLAMTQGVGRTTSMVQGTLAAGNPTGYSAAGTVIEVGAGVHDFRVGDRVACAGAQCAFHAEVIRVPVNLAVAVPQTVSLAHASTVALGAIALQGLRRATPTMGETFVVIGLGLLGQLVTQLLKANGCRVIGTDLDPTRIALAREHGLDVGVEPVDGADLTRVAQLTDGHGADGVIITASTSSDAVVSTAFQMCRKKGRVVLIGDVGLDLRRADFYAKELDFFISCSYGPGRYDARYEEDGQDYPLPFVRWTENRNMAEYLRLLGEGRVKIDRLIHATHPLADAEQAYASLSPSTENGGARPLMVLLQHPVESVVPSRVTLNPKATPRGGGQIRLAVIGSGEFAAAMHLPNVKSLGELFHLQAIASRTGHKASAAAAHFGAAYATTDHRKVLEDANVDAVLICTRHDQHAALALEALKAGKHVLVEKPLALDDAGLRTIESFYAAAGDKPRPVLLTGFNRRFAPMMQDVAQLTASRINPMIINYTMNAGRLPATHWTYSPEGGGRNLGEACHIYDLFTRLTGARVVDVSARSLRPKTAHEAARDNFIATVTFDDGSVASLTYTALGHTDHPKETMEIFFDGKAIRMQDYLSLTIAGAKSPSRTARLADKGHKQMLVEFADAVRSGSWASPLWQQVQAMEIALRVDAQI